MSPDMHAHSCILCARTKKGLFKGILSSSNRSKRHLASVAPPNPRKGAPRTNRYASMDDWGPTRTSMQSTQSPQHGGVSTTCHR